MATLTVSSGYAHGLLALAVAKGADHGALLEQSGIAESALQDFDGRIPFANYIALMRAAKALSRDPALGLHYGETSNLSDVSVVGLVMQSATNIDDAFKLLNRFVPLIIETKNTDDGERFTLREARDGVWVVDNRLHADSFPELTESAFASLVSGPRRYGAPPFVKAMRVTHPDPGHAREYRRIFDVAVTFGARENAYLVDRRLVAQKEVPPLPPYLFGVLSARAEALLRELDDARSARGQVERLLMSVLHKGEVSMQAVAKQMGVSRRTLLRRLQQEGVTFEAVVDQLRHRLALDYLAGPRATVYEAGYLVGFSTPAAFSRAFKRWTGCSPSEVRGRLRGTTRERLLA